MRGLRVYYARRRDHLWCALSADLHIACIYARVQRGTSECRRRRPSVCTKNYRVRWSPPLYDTKNYALSACVLKIASDRPVICVLI